MSWYNVIDFRSGKVDKRWLPALVLVVFLSSALVRWTINHFGVIGFLVVIVPLALLAVWEAKVRMRSQRDDQRNRGAQPG